MPPMSRSHPPPAGPVESGPTSGLHLALGLWPQCGGQIVLGSDSSYPHRPHTRRLVRMRGERCYLPVPPQALRP
ncbi:uncharacterized protein BDW47DRAFT_98248 [Aspergillus candidus]|uniref:Uncharacterized protein n=1 Tax=Aspergillus candidus TaxID=41067 RepID=A0A2I2FNT7_ASPCN|nr:hypothetical protein BDW47DRAFT_98248 [Aspergillus candidus]PLB42307.1 hypothetical protein BDW47DRAFT_98248 [Aspergillus candidus]